MSTSSAKAVQLVNGEVVLQEKDMVEVISTSSEAKTIDCIYDDVKIEIKEEPVVNHCEVDNVSKNLNIFESNFSNMHLNSVGKNRSYDSMNTPNTEHNQIVPINPNKITHLIDELNDVLTGTAHEGVLYAEINDVFIEEPRSADYDQANIVGRKNVTAVTEKTLTTEDEVDQSHEKSVDVINDTEAVENLDRSSNIQVNKIHALNGNTLNEGDLLTAGEAGVVESRQDFVLNIILEKNTECEKRVYRKILGTVEELFVSLKREDLHMLQKSLKDERYRDSGLADNRKPKRQRWISNQPKQFYCRACPFAADHKFDLFIHIRKKHEDLAAAKKIPPSQNMCPGDDPRLIWFKCTDCAFVTKYKLVLEKHFITHKQLHEVENFCCASCSYVSKSKNTLIKHMNTHKDDSEVVIHRCPHCRFSTRNHLYLRKHVQFIHKKEENEVLECHKCAYKTVYKAVLQKHMLIHNNSRKFYKCPVCPFQTPYKRVLQTTHRLSHEGDELRIFSCATCSYKAKTKDILIRHQLVHRRPDEVVMYKCGICPYETRHRYHIQCHREKHVAPDEDNMRPCDLCPYQAKSARSLRQHHLRVHRNPNEGPIYKCTKCPYQTRCTGNLKRHNITHMNVEEINWIQCESCDYQAKSIDRLRAHFNNVHKDPEQVQWYKCDQCDIKFRNKGNLKRHKLCHMDPSIANTFHCHQCSFSAKSKNELKQHMESHMNVILHCNKCKYQTKFTNSLWRHKKERH